MVITKTTSHDPLIDPQEARRHHLNTVRLLATRPLLLTLLGGTATGRAILRALGYIPALCDEADRLRFLLTWVRLDHANLIAAGRATLAAANEGEHDPLYYLRDELSDHTGDDPRTHHNRQADEGGSL
ncbi:hypothetical protein J5X84_29880 [Streptosporangiaceae bacterium NEAU-GS5]|nr:hypothetical protein [Streptosporangiaceae bacterium NEAU-GS5]